MFSTIIASLVSIVVGFLVGLAAPWVKWKIEKQKLARSERADLIREAREIIDRFCVNTAIIAVPHIAAQQVCDKLVEYGITGIINFAPVILKVPEHIIINNIHLSDEIESVIYCVSLEGTRCPE